MWRNPLETADLITFTEEILNAKIHFLCSAIESSCSLILHFVTGINHSRKTRKYYPHYLFHKKLLTSKFTCNNLYLLFAIFSIYFQSSTNKSLSYNWNMTLNDWFVLHLEYLSQYMKPAAQSDFANCTKKISMNKFSQAGAVRVKSVLSTGISLPPIFSL